jgi:hypothetical protein
MSPFVIRNVFSYQHLPSFGELFITLTYRYFDLKYVKSLFLSNGSVDKTRSPYGDSTSQT